MSEDKMESTNTKKMSIEEKIDFIDREIRLLHKFCLDSGYSPVQVEKFAEPFLGRLKSTKQKMFFSGAITLAVLIAVISALLHVDPVYKTVVAAGKHASIKILPYWDWSKMYDWDCLIENPMFVDDAKQEEEDCKLCKSLKDVKKVSNISQEVMAEEYIKSCAPVIVLDGMNDWPDTAKDVSIKTLLEMYNTDDELQKHTVCSLNTSTVYEEETQEQVFEDAAEGKVQNYYINWENCEKEAGKVIRAKFYRRPYFLPHFVEVLQPNMVFISDQYNGKELLQLPASSHLLLLIQMKGQTGIRITPHTVCEGTCHVLNTVITQGDMLVVPVADALYDVTYLPDGPESVMLGIIGDYD